MISSSGESPSSSTSKRERSSSIPAGAIDSRTRTFRPSPLPRRPRARGSRRRRARSERRARRAPARPRRAPSRCRTRRTSRCGRSGRSRPSARPWPPAIVTPCRSRSARARSVESIPSGMRAAVTTAERSSSGENSSRPIALIPARQARPRRTCRSKAASRPLVEQQAERDVERDDERDRGREGAVELLLRVARPLPVEVVARQRRPGDLLPGRGRHGGGREPGRRHQRLLRAGDDDVEAPVVHLQRHRAEARDGVDDRPARPRPWRPPPAPGCRRRHRSRSPSGRGRRARRARSPRACGRDPPRTASRPTRT